jgi:hypothetical protein
MEVMQILKTADHDRKLTTSERNHLVKVVEHLHNARVQEHNAKAEVKIEAAKQSWSVACGADKVRSTIKALVVQINDLNTQLCELGCDPVNTDGIERYYHRNELDEDNVLLKIKSKPLRKKFMEFRKRIEVLEKTHDTYSELRFKVCAILGFATVGEAIEGLTSECPEVMDPSRQIPESV